MGNSSSLPCSQWFWCCDECCVQPKARSSELNVVTSNPISSGLVMAPADELDCEYEFKIALNASKKKNNKQQPRQ